MSRVRMVLKSKFSNASDVGTSEEAVRRKEMIFSSSALPFDFPTLRDNNAFLKNK